MKTIYYNNYRLICLIFMWCCVIPLYSTENMYYVYRVNTTQSYDFATNLNEIAPNAEIVFRSPINIDSISGIKYAVDNCLLLYGVSNLDILINNLQLSNNILSIDSITWEPMIYAIKTHSLSHTQLDSICNILNHSDFCEIAELDYAYFNSLNNTIQPEQNPQFELEQWYLHDIEGTNPYQINAYNAWNYSTGEDILVAIIDEGVDLTHKDLIGNLTQGYDCTDGLDGFRNGSCNYDSEAPVHGTQCAGVIGATNDSVGIIGVAPDCQMTSIRVSRHKLTNPTIFYGKKSWYIKGLKKAYEIGADVVNCSWTFTQIDTHNQKLMDKILDTLTEEGRSGLGTIVVFSVGNDGYSKILYPSTHHYVIAVGSSSKYGRRSYFSNFGSGLDIVAPGEDIYTTTKKKKRQSDGTYIENRYVSVDGTSFACPIVAGVAALMLSSRPYIFRDSVETILKQTAYRLPAYTYNYSSVSLSFLGPRNGDVGYGLVDAYAAMLEMNKKYIQDMTYSSNTTEKELGTFIYVGDSVTNRRLYGDVKIHEDAEVLLQATKEIRFTDGFHAKTGSNMIAQIVPESEWKNLSSARRNSKRSNFSMNNNQSKDEEGDGISQSLYAGLECSNTTIICTNVYSPSGLLLRTFASEIYTLSHLPSGMYILQYRMSDGSVKSEKVTNNK